MSTTITLEDGRAFPVYNGEALSWSPGLYNTWNDQHNGYPKTKAVLAAMLEHRPEQLEAERREMLKASFNSMFEHNAKKMLDLIEECQASKANR